MIGETTKILNGVTYYFDGWYDNQYLQGNAYDFTGKKMPAKESLHIMQSGAAER